MTASELIEVLKDLPGDFPVKVIMDGMIDSDPSFNVDDDCLYMEGVSPAAQEACRVQNLANIFCGF